VTGNPSVINEETGPVNQRGLTLIEILVAVMIVSLIMFGLGTIFIAASRHMTGSRAQISAALLGSYYLANLSQQVREDEWGSNCLSNSTLCAAPSISLSGITYSIDCNNAFLSVGNLTKTSVTVSWNEPTPD
jgi:prepilin-type N-terminal cleavage/methylation domain-containing protein